MNIAFFSKQLPSDQPNGVSVQVHRLAEALTAMGHFITVFSFSPPVPDVKYRHVALRTMKLPRLFRKFIPALRFRKIDTSPFDIVHYHGDDYLCKGSPRRVRTFYGSALREALHAASPGRFFYQTLFYLFERISCRKKGALVAISEDTFRYLPRITRCIPCCIPLDRYTPGPDRKKTAHPSILFLGDFSSRKRGKLLLSVFAGTILPKHPDCTLTVVGPVPCSGPNVEYAGRCNEDELISRYRKSWIFCMPSSYEGFGVPVLEAMACGTPVVATENPGSSELIEDGENGVICTPYFLGESLNDLLGDGKTRTQLAENAMQFVKRFGSGEVAARYERLYREITDTS